MVSQRLCFNMTAQQYESALESGEVPEYNRRNVESEAVNGIHESCGLFAYYLRSAGSWYLADLPERTEAYQVLFLPSYPPYQQPVLLRVIANKGQAPTVSAVRMLGLGDDPGEIDRAVSRAMSRSEWLQWSQLIDHLGFWSDESPFSNELVACMHGTTYLFEGSRFESGDSIQNSVKHKVWYPYCPGGDVEDGLLKTTSFLFDLTQTYPREW